jgi:hypothetical protein
MFNHSIRFHYYDNDRILHMHHKKSVPIICQDTCVLLVIDVIIIIIIIIIIVSCCNFVWSDVPMSRGVAHTHPIRTFAKS